jgi:hypothetical protein
METMLNSEPNAQLLPSASHDHNTMLVAVDSVPIIIKKTLFRNGRRITVISNIRNVS